ncbi:hypothetical protein PIB30_010262 [Stylosanthes scabra]|uniref:Uncharacterized protein n=1 Tax=Stylosanthes scabra TaxID=79078 RepID=A0ABU6T5W6_9FABA|nr:hypothetical protein [Stylosanthes scabra]
MRKILHPEVEANVTSGTRSARYAALYSSLNQVCSMGSEDKEAYTMAREAIADIAGRLRSRVMERQRKGKKPSAATVKDPKVAATKGAPRKGKETAGVGESHGTHVDEVDSSSGVDVGCRVREACSQPMVSHSGRAGRGAVGGGNVFLGGQCIQKLYASGGGLFPGSCYRPTMPAGGFPEPVPSPGDEHVFVAPNSAFQRMNEIAGPKSNSSRFKEA